MEQSLSLRAPTKIIASDRRLTMHLMGLWQGLREGPSSCPRLDDFAGAMPDDFWADCCVLDTIADGTFEVRQVGENLARRSGLAAPRVAVTDLPAEGLLAAALRDHALALARRAPILDEGEARDEQGRRVLFRSIILPLAGDDGEVTRLLVGARCRPVGDDA